VHAVSIRVRVSGLLVAAFAFGLVAALVEGKSGGQGTVVELRNALGNLSTPWLLVAFLAGTTCSRLRSGALLGLAATAAALIGYYALSAVVVDVAGSFADDLRHVLSANRGYLQGGLLSGPLFGVLGAWWQERRRLGASIVAGTLLMAEPLALLLIGAVGPDQLSGDGVPTVVRIVPGWGLTLDQGVTSLAVYVAEFAIGLGLVLLALRSRSSRRLVASTP
jgi:hypothetical protein